MSVTTDLGPCSRSVLLAFHSAKPNDILSILAFQKQCSRLERYYRSCHVRIEIAHSCFNLYAPKLAPIFYYAIKHGYRCFIS